jgi:benzodiazapine receptor
MDYLDVLGIIGWIVFHYWQVSSSSGTLKGRRWYNERKSQLTCAIPGYVFGLVWLVLYGLLTAAAVIYFHDYVGDAHYTTIFILWISNIVLNKMWSMLFFDMRAIRSALLVVILMLGSGAAIVVLLGVSEAWLPFGLYMPYVVWTGVALVLNAQWLRVKK